MLVLLEHGEVEILAIATGWITTAKKGCKSLGTEAMRTRVYLPSYGSHIHRASRHCFISMWCSSSSTGRCPWSAAQSCHSLSDPLGSDLSNAVNSVLFLYGGQYEFSTPRSGMILKQRHISHVG